MDVFTVVVTLSLVAIGIAVGYCLVRKLWLYVLAGVLAFAGGVWVVITYEAASGPQWPGSVALMAASILLIAGTLRLRAGSR